MTRKLVMGEKPLFWIGSSLKDITRFPSEVQRSVGFALSAAQYGGKHPSAKPWKGEGPGILEIIKDHDGDTYGALCTVRFANAVYALHAFQKKSPHGIATRKSTLLWSKSVSSWRRWITRRDMAKRIPEQVIRSSGNVFADMGLPDAAELDTKARLGAALKLIVKRKRLTQAEIATALSINQPKVSALLNYKLEGFSVERLMHFLVALGQDVEIVVKAKPTSRSARIAVNAA
ncbi:MAG: XRE family transcriptional regulator [Terracidiphilus sp.]